MLCARQKNVVCIPLCAQIEMTDKNITCTNDMTFENFIPKNLTFVLKKNQHLLIEFECLLELTIFLLVQNVCF